MVEATERRVLVVDDEEDIRASTCLLLEAMGCKPIPVADPSEVLPLAREHQPGLILQDLRMPQLNVAGLVAALRSDPHTETIPIVFFSANADIAATAQRYNVWGFLRKPFSAAALEQVVEGVFGAPQNVEDPARRIRDMFHDQWNVMAAMANYAHVLRTQAKDPQMANMARDMEGQLLRLEASIDRMHVFITAVANAAPEAAEPVSKPARPPRPARAVRADSPQDMPTAF